MSADLPPPILVGVGTEAWLWSEAVARVGAQCVKPGSEPFDRVLLDTEQSSLEEIFSALQTPPMNSPRRLVVLEGFLKTQDDLMEGLARYADHPNPTTCLMFQVAEPLSPSIRSGFGKMIKEIACQPLRDAPLEAWLKQRSQQELKKTLETDAARMLIERSGSSMALLAQQLEQLSLYVADRGFIRRDDVAAVIGWSIEERAFGLVDALVRRQRAVALRMLRRLLLEEGVAPEELLGALSWHFRRLGKAIYRVSRGESPQRVVEAMRIPWNAQGTYLTAVRSTRWTDMVDTLEELSEIDEQLKTGRIPALALLEPYIWKLAGSGELTKTST